MSLIEVKNISKSFGSKTLVLNDIKGLEGTFDVVIEATGSNTHG